MERRARHAEKRVPQRLGRPANQRPYYTFGRIVDARQYSFGTTPDQVIVQPVDPDEEVAPFANVGGDRPEGLLRRKRHLDDALAVDQVEARGPTRQVQEGRYDEVDARPHSLWASPLCSSPKLRSI